MAADRPVELHEQLMEQVVGLRSSTEWIEAMIKVARFRDYSMGNWLLLWSQAEARGTEVTRPAGYRTWQRLGRQVRKGERGYRILAPVVCKRETDTGDTERFVTGFRTATVFDVSQTDGDDLPDISPPTITGTDIPGVTDTIVSLIEAEGFSYETGVLAGPNGTTFPLLKKVVVEAGLEPAQTMKTAIHELAHVMLHSTDRFECPSRIEVEAESVAYVVCGALGFDSSSYSVAYVAGWAEQSDDPSRVLLVTAETIVRTARRIITDIDQQQKDAALQHSSLSHF